MNHKMNHKRIMRVIALALVVVTIVSSMSAAFATDIKDLQASDLDGLSSKEVVELVGPLFTEDQKESGVLACVSMAQFILESGYGHSKLAAKSNNCFGMKAGKKWEGKTVTSPTREYRNGGYVRTSAKWRAYDSILDSIKDHSHMLTTAKNGKHLRYDGVTGDDPRTVCQVIKDGGYATAPDYVDKLMDIIDSWDLTRFDYVESDEDTKISDITGFSQDFLTRMGEYCGTSFWVFSNPDHEALVLADTGDISELEHLLGEDQVSDNLFHYDVEQGRLERADQYAKRAQED